MSLNVKERYAAQLVPVDTAVRLTSDSVGSFYAVTAGTITITADPDFGIPGAITLLNLFPVTAGQVVELKMYLSKTGGTLTTAGGASGTVTTI